MYNNILRLNFTTHFFHKNLRHNFATKLYQEILRQILTTKFYNQILQPNFTIKFYDEKVQDFLLCTKEAQGAVKKIVYQTPAVKSMAIFLLCTKDAPTGNQIFGLHYVIMQKSFVKLQH